MDQYFTFTTLLGLWRWVSCLPILWDAKSQKFQSVQKILSLVETAAQTRPTLPGSVLTLNPLDRNNSSTQPNGTIRCLSPSSTELATGPTEEDCLHCWYNFLDTVLLLIQLQRFHNQYPIQDLQKHLPILCCLHLRRCLLLIPQANLENQPLRRVLLPQVSGACSAEWIHAWPPRYNLYYLDVKRTVWWVEDFKETLSKVYRQANDNKQSDFQDSELILQDFVNRYVDPSAASPMKGKARLFWFTQRLINPNYSIS